MTSSGGRTLFWHRRDLRIVDNRGLRRAAASERVVPVFCFDDRLLQYAGTGRVAFMLEALADLRSRYQSMGSDLVVARESPDEAIPRLVEEYDIDRVVWNEDYSRYARERDETVEDALLSEGIDVEWVQNHVLHEPGTILTSDGTPYSVFSYYWKKWEDRESDEPVEAPDADSLASVEGEPLPTLSDLGFDEPAAAVLPGRRADAIDRLEAFLDGPVFAYSDRRDVPAAAGTSRLSQDLKFGLLGIREVYERTESVAAEGAGDDAENVREFQRQLAWREFYTQVLDARPGMVTENFSSFANPIEWRTAPDELAAWKRGETGYPIVDAGMRQLLAEGYMHNRLRMIVASFLTKDLLVDWREGYRWFRDRLVDHDTANDVGGWQWAASTGPSAQPYFRIFNPTTQGKRYDPDAEYVRDYVAELEDVSPKMIHSWVDLDPETRRNVAPDYPAPIVDHGARREAAIATFERARGND